MADIDTDRPAWSYRGATGPQYWSSLSDSFKMCDDGPGQSPIDITGYENASGGAIEFSYDSLPIAVYNNGRTTTVWYEPGSSMAVDGGLFQLVQAHYHAPSEHLIDGRRFSAEVHLLHENHDGDLAVVAVLLELGSANRVIDNLIVSADSVHAPYDLNPLLHSRFLEPDGRSHYRYVGSTTTPPCLEPVEWFVMAETATISEDQLSTLDRSTHGPNNRAIQPLNGRLIRRVI